MLTITVETLQLSATVYFLDTKFSIHLQFISQFNLYKQGDLKRLCLAQALIGKSGDASGVWHVRKTVRVKWWALAKLSLIQ